MDMKNLQYKLTEKYLNVFQQIRYTFFIFGKMFFNLNDVWWILFLFFVPIGRTVIGYLFMNAEFTSIIEMLSFIYIFYYLAYFLFYQKVIFKIEEKGYLNLGRSASRFFFLYFVYYLVNYVFTHFQEILFPSILPVEIYLIFPLVIWIILIIVWFKMFYFIPLFSARPFDLQESWSYGTHLTKGNRLKMIFPGIMLLCLYLAKNMIYSPVLSYFLGIDVSEMDLQVIFVITEFVGTFIIIFYIIWHCLIYLNVEYMDRKIK